MPPAEEKQQEVSQEAAAAAAKKRSRDEQHKALLEKIAAAQGKRLKGAGPSEVIINGFKPSDFASGCFPPTSWWAQHLLKKCKWTVDPI